MNTTPEPRGAPAERYPSVTAGVLVTNHDGSQSVDDRIRELEHQLATIRHALDNRDTIGMAKGVLMAREGIGPDEAFAMLRRASQRTNRKLAEIAADIVCSAIPSDGAAGDQPDRRTG